MTPQNRRDRWQKQKDEAAIKFATNLQKINGYVSYGSQASGLDAFKVGADFGYAAAAKDAEKQLDREREKSERLAKALQRMLNSEALKEAPFYNYCESVSDAMELLAAHASPEQSEGAYESR